MSKKDKDILLVPGANCACLIDDEGFLVVADIDLGKDCKIKECGSAADTVVCSYTDDGLPIAIKVCTDHAEDLMNYRLASAGVDTFYSLTKVESDGQTDHLLNKINNSNKKLLN